MYTNRMKKINVFTGLLLILATFELAQAHRVKNPSGPYYFQSDNNQYLAEVIPTVMPSRDKKFLLVKTSQTITIYRNGENNSWQEVNSFKAGGMRLIKEILIPNNGKAVLVRIDENPMVSNINKEDGLFVFSVDGKMIKSYSHLSVFGIPGIFREMKLKIDNKKNELLISGKSKIKRVALPE